MGFLSSIGGFLGNLVAPGLGGLIGGGLGSLAEGAIGSSSAQHATNVQTDAARAAQQAQLAMYGQTRSDQMPWLQTGGGAVQQLGYLMGVNPYSPATAAQFQVGGAGGAAGTPYAPNTAMGAFGSLARPFGMSDYQADPGYAFRLSEGQRALERSAAARGGLLSGAAMKAMNAYSQGQASQEYGNAFDRYNANQTNLYNRLAGLSGTGQQSAQNIGATGQNTANQVGDLYTQAGNARAAGIGAQTAAWQTGLGGIGGILGGGYSGGSTGGAYGGGFGDYGNLGRIDWYQ